MKDFAVGLFMLTISFCLLVGSAHPFGDYHESEYQAIKASRDEIQVTNTTVRCFVDAGLIITFPSNMSDQKRQDMLYSFLFAQLAADRNFSRNIQLEKWKHTFINVLMKIGWFLRTKTFADLNVMSAKFTLTNLTNLVMEITGGNNDANTFKKVFNTYNALSSNDSAVKAFTKSAYDNTTHDVTIMVASVHNSGIVNFLLLSLQGVKDATARPLSHTYDTKDIKTKKILINQLFLISNFSNSTLIANRLKPYIKSEIKEITLKE